MRKGGIAITTRKEDKPKKKYYRKKENFVQQLDVVKKK